MKAFIAGVITLSLLIATITVNAFLIIKKTDIILDEIGSLADTVDKADDSKLQILWQKSRAWIALTVHRENVDDIDDTLSQLELEIKEQNNMSTIEIQAQIESLRALEELIEEAKAEAETLRDAIKQEMLIRDTEELSAGQYIVRWTSVLSQRFDTTSFKKVMPEVYKAYTKQVSSKRFTISV